MLAPNEDVLRARRSPGGGGAGSFAACRAMVADGSRSALVAGHSDEYRSPPRPGRGPGREPSGAARLERSGFEGYDRPRGGERGLELGQAAAERLGVDSPA